MKRLIYNVPRWPLFLHRESRGLRIAETSDTPAAKVSDEVFYRLFTGEIEADDFLPPGTADEKYGEWAQAFHMACELNPDFQRLSAQTRGDAIASAVAVDNVLVNIRPQPKQKQPKQPGQQGGAPSQDGEGEGEAGSSGEGGEKSGKQNPNQSKPQDQQQPAGGEQKPNEKPGANEQQPKDASSSSQQPATGAGSQKQAPRQMSSADAAKAAGFDPSQFAKAMKAAVDKAETQTEELKNDIAALEGCGFGGVGENGAVDIKAIQALAEKLKYDARLKKIATLAGRFKTMASQKRRTKSTRGAEEVVDVEIGDEVSRLLPSELVKLADPELSILLERDLVEKQAMQYRMQGKDEQGEGPIVVVLDKSGSMHGERDIWATALTIALLDHAKSQKRPFALIAYNYGVVYEQVVKVGEALDPKALSIETGGGTDTEDAVRHALALVKKNQDEKGVLAKADVILVTDGDCYGGNVSEIRALAKSLKTSIFPIGIQTRYESVSIWAEDAVALKTLKLDDGLATKLFAPRPTDHKNDEVV